MTSNPAVTGSVTDESDITALTLTLPELFLGPVDVTTELAADGSFLLDESLLESLNGEAIPDGPLTVRLTAEDEFGNVSEALDVVMILDSVAPEVEFAPAGLIFETFAELPIQFSEALEPNAAETASYTLTDSSGGELPIDAVDVINPTVVRLRLAEELGDGDYQLELSSGLRDIAGNSITGPLTFAFTIEDAPSIAGALAGAR